MESLKYTFLVNKDEYRSMCYFNTFFIRPIQTAFIIICWIGSLLMLTLYSLEIGNITHVMRLCAIVVALTLPIMIFSVEQSTRRYQRSIVNGNECEKSVVLNAQEVRMCETEQSKEFTLTWNQFIAAYETKTLYILYRDRQRTIVLPKRVVEDTVNQQLRGLLQAELGKYFQVRT